MKRIVLTGGPCAGKTTALSYLQKKLSERGVSVVVVPEVPTMVINSGIDPTKLDPEQYRRFEELLLRTQIRFENDVFGTVARIKNGKKTVMICDRGCMDMSAYMTEQVFERILSDNGFNRVSLRDRRYDAVFHLVSVAVDKPKCYNLDNTARLEQSVEEAKKVDERTKNVWLGHPHLRVIDNSTDLEGKLKRLLDAILKAIGIPTETETERKFLIHDFTGEIPVPHREVFIQQFYVKGEDGRVRYRARNEVDGMVDEAVFYRTEKSPTDSAMSRIEIERQISYVEYYRARQLRDPRWDVIEKYRCCFLWHNQYFELDSFIKPERHRGLKMLEIELTAETDPVSLPGWLGKVTEVTEDPKFRNSHLAKRP